MANVLGVTPTKGSLMAIQKSLSLSTLGFELLDRKRNILIREMMLLIDKVKSLRGEISSTYREAYEALQEANVTLGMVQETAMAVPVDDGVTITYRSVMGVEIPNVRLAESEIRMCYGLDRTNSRLDYAYVCFQKAKRVTALLAEVENSVYRLANAIRKTQRRANALENIVIPRYEETAKFITDALEEKDREEFSRLKSSKAKNSRRHKPLRRMSGGGALWRIRILQARGYWQTPCRMVT
ncbi:MAG: V-type ATP synthase subunit D [Anaerotruncus massiliensis (ex Togo et al. 2019)]